MKSEDLVPLVTMERSEEAGMLKELLENDGIPTVVMGALDPFFSVIPALGVKISVRAMDLERARGIYETYFNSQSTDEEEPEEPPSA